MSESGFNQEMLRAFVADRDEPCPNCGYSLRDLTTAICPECGLELELRVGLAEPRQASWVAGLVGLAAGMGFFLMVLIVGLYQIAANGFREWDFFAWFGSMTAVHLVPLAAWIRWRPWIRSRRRDGRVLLAVSCWLLPALAMLVLVAFAPM